VCKHYERLGNASRDALKLFMKKIFEDIVVWWREECVSDKALLKPNDYRRQHGAKELSAARTLQVNA
jgi:hypothetical protein